MAKKILKKGDIECDFHNDLFMLHQNYGEVEKNPKYWDDCLSEITKIAKKYHGTDMQMFTEQTLIAFANYLNLKSLGEQNYPAKIVAEIVSCGRSKEQIAEIINELGAIK